MAGYALGVDIGTTWTAAATVRQGSEPQVVSLGGRTAAIPTVVHLAADGTASVGDAAERRAATDPDRIAREFKRRIGDTTPVLVGGQPWSPESLMATVLRWVLARVSELEGEAPASIVVTHPANWGPLRRELLEQAVAHAGIAVRFVTEPEAAAVHYASATRVPDGTVIGVYDLGGGTFDATVLRKQGDGFEVLGQPGGVERLGGLDFDAAVLGHISGLLGPAWTALDPADAATIAAVARLRADCVLAKEALSEDPDATAAVTLPTVATEIRLTRGELEAMIRQAIEQSADAFERAVAAAGTSVATLDRILLVGGSSRIPLVSQVLTSRFGRPLALDTHPKHAVALGAARLALGAGPAPAPVPAPVAAAAEPVAAEPQPQPAAWPTATEPVVVASPPTETLPAPAPLVKKRFPVWIPVVVVLAVLGVVAALTLGGGDDDPATTDFERTGDQESADTSAVDVGSTFFDPAVVQTLDGEWFYNGFATECQGLADEDCAAFEDDFTSNLLISCDGEACEIAINESAPQQMFDDGESGLIGAGFLSDDDGFSCDGGPDPTEWQVIIDNIDTDGDDVAVSFDATIKLTSQDGGNDGNSCAFEQVVAEGTASPVGGDGGEVDGEAAALTITLTWESNVDLDLNVFDPDGNEVGPGSDQHSGDDNGQCGGDDTGFEQVIYTVSDAPPSGTYNVDVSSFPEDSGGCGGADFSVSFQVGDGEPEVQGGEVEPGGTTNLQFELP